ncbi:flavin reductase family protein [Halopseudomonas sp.]|uniref:flavin reductase family protein n=1 Tax=Halopseudomonas sp. TaxID=2901191 RepID=UPI0030038727
MPLPIPLIEPTHFRQALGHYASGITVITSQLDETPIGFTCQSFYSVSVTPPLVSFSVMANSFSYPLIRQAGRFAVNILSGKQAAISNRFAKQGADKWRGVGWHASPLGNPVIDGSLFSLDCEIHAEHAAGDHLIVIGEVKTFRQQQAADTRPLVYFKGRYCSLAELASA